MRNNNLPEKFPNFVIFKTADGKVNIDVYFQDDTLWLPKIDCRIIRQRRSIITEHLKIFLRRANWQNNWYVGNSDIPRSTALSKARK